jgi:hypothetical protein
MAATVNRLDKIKARLAGCPAPVRINNGGLDLEYGDDVFCVELYWGARNQKDDVLFSKMMNFLANSRDDIAWLVATGDAPNPGADLGHVVRWAFLSGWNSCAGETMAQVVSVCEARDTASDDLADLAVKLSDFADELRREALRLRVDGTE